MAARHAVLVAEGTRRTADEISWTSTGQSLDRRAVKLLKGQLVIVAHPYKQADQSMRTMKDIHERPWNEQ